MQAFDGTRRQLLKALALGTASAALPRCGWLAESRPAGSRPRQPNIVLIMADDLGYECLACNGGTSYRTPALDALAARGMRFERCYSQPLCTPSRVQIMTGRYNFRNYTDFGALDPGETTFGHVLKAAGYATCAAGKWQLAARDKPVAGTLPEHAGFDEHCLWQVEQLGSRYWDPVIRQNGVMRTDLAGRYGPDIFCEYLTDFMERHRDGPFFAYYPMALTHGPFLPTPATPGAPDPAAGNTRYFADMVAYMDALVGRIVGSLEELGIAGRTLVLFTGDNGSPRNITSRMGERVIQGGKAYTTDAGTHVPLVARWPGITPPGGVCDDLVDFSDFLPTLAAAAGARLPAGRVLDGRSFLPQLTGRAGTPREWVFCHYDPRHGPWAPARFARDKRYKLYDDGRYFDTAADPLEESSLDPADLTQAAAEARARLGSVLEQIAR